MHRLYKIAFHLPSTSDAEDVRFSFKSILTLEFYSGRAVVESPVASFDHHSVCSTYMYRGLKVLVAV